MKSLFLLVLVAIPTLAAPVPKDFLRKIPDYCPMAVGDVREYVQPENPNVVMQTRSITAVEEKDGARYFTQKIDNSLPTRLKVDKTGVYVVSAEPNSFTPVYKVVAPDMKAGDIWISDDPNGMTRTVGKPEKLSVPAGTFTAYPITISYKNFPGVTPQILWYADQVGLVRIDQGPGSTMMVLNKFVRGKATK